MSSAPGGIRTPNLLIRSQMLYPLSYRRLFSWHSLTALGRHRARVRYRPPKRPGSAIATPTFGGTSAEAEGFEPSVPLRAQHISSVSHSAALARFPGPPWGGHRPVTLPGAPTRGQNASRDDGWSVAEQTIARQLRHHPQRGYAVQASGPEQPSPHNHFSRKASRLKMLRSTPANRNRMLCVKLP